MSWSCISWDSDHNRTHALRRRVAERKLRYGVASCNFFLVLDELRMERSGCIVGKNLFVSTCDFILIYWDSGHRRIHTLRRRAAKKI